MPDHAARIYAEQEKLLPPVLIRGTLLLVCAMLAIAVFARVTGRPLESVPPAAPVSAEARLLLQSDSMTGAVKVWDTDGAGITAFTPEEGGFIAGVHRVILRERSKHRAAADGPVVLQALENGRMIIIDPVTGWRADLMGFGAANADAFARLLAEAQKVKAHGIAD